MNNKEMVSLPKLVLLWVFRLQARENVFNIICKKIFSILDVFIDFVQRNSLIEYGNIDFEDKNSQVEKHSYMVAAP